MKELLLVVVKLLPSEKHRMSHPQQSEENIHFSWRQLDTVYEMIIGILQNTYIDNGSIHKQHIEQQT